MKREDVIDLRVAILGVGRDIQKMYPHLVQDADLQAIREANNVLYIATRILFRIAMRGGVSKERVRQIAKDAKEIRWEAQGATLMDAIEVSKYTGEYSVNGAFGQVDACMVDPRCRSRINPWFIDRFYPTLLKKSARGEQITNRELEIVLLVVANAQSRRRA